jgi:hypothetical protein
MVVSLQNAMASPIKLLICFLVMTRGAAFVTGPPTWVPSNNPWVPPLGHSTCTREVALLWREAFGILDQKTVRSNVTNLLSNLKDLENIANQLLGTRNSVMAWTVPDQLMHAKGTSLIGERAFRVITAKGKTFASQCKSETFGQNAGSGNLPEISGAEEFEEAKEVIKKYNLTLLAVSAHPTTQGVLSASGFLLSPMPEGTTLSALQQANTFVMSSEGVISAAGDDEIQSICLSSLPPSKSSRFGQQMLSSYISHAGSVLRDWTMMAQAQLGNLQSVTPPHESSGVTFPLNLPMSASDLKLSIAASIASLQSFGTFSVSEEKAVIDLVGQIDKFVTKLDLSSPTIALNATEVSAALGLQERVINPIFQATTITSGNIIHGKIFWETWPTKKVWHHYDITPLVAEAGKVINDSSLFVSRSQVTAPTTHMEVGPCHKGYLGMRMCYPTPISAVTMAAVTCGQAIVRGSGAMYHCPTRDIKQTTFVPLTQCDTLRSGRGDLRVLPGPELTGESIHLVCRGKPDSQPLQISRDPFTLTNGSDCKIISRSNQIIYSPAADISHPPFSNPDNKPGSTINGGHKDIVTELATVRLTLYILMGAIGLILSVTCVCCASPCVRFVPCRGPRKFCLRRLRPTPQNRRPNDSRRSSRPQVRDGAGNIYELRPLRERQRPRVAAPSAAVRFNEWREYEAQRNQPLRAITSL